MSLTLILSLTACGKAQAGWKEQYDLGIRYVNEAKYEEAILAFNKALEIDPKQAPVYIALAEVYLRQENYTAAQETLDKAVAEIGTTPELKQAIEKTQQAAQPAPTPTPQPTPSPRPQQEQPVPHYIPQVEGIISTRRTDNADGSRFMEDFDENGNKISDTSYDKNGDINFQKFY